MLLPWGFSFPPAQVLKTRDLSLSFLVYMLIDHDGAVEHVYMYEHAYLSNNLIWHN